MNPLRPSLRPRHVGRYRDLARLFLRYGRSDVVRLAGLDEVLGEELLVDDETVVEAEQLASDLEAMGPTFVKLGQLLSTRADLLPAPYLEALSRLQDSVEPLEPGVVEQVVSEELGVRLSRIFPEFDPEPLASASLGQVHRATLRDGRQVVVKVQRPDVRRRIADDMEVLEEVAEFLERRVEQARQFAIVDLLERFRRTLIDELDYRKEAANLVRLGEIVAGRDTLVVPKPVDDFTTSRVLTMEYLDGAKVTDLSPLARIDVDGERLARDLVEAYLDQILVEGFFHADPHPGNVLLLRDGRLGLVDVGMVGRVTSTTRDRLVRLLLAVADEHSEEVARLAEEMSTALPSFDQKRFVSRCADLVDRSTGQPMGELDAGRIVLELTRISADCGLRPPPELAMVGKALLNLDQVAQTLDPAFDPLEVVRGHVGRLLRTGTLPSLSGMASTLFEAREFAGRLPGRVNRVLDAAADGRFEVKVRAFDETMLLRGIHKSANRIVMGLVLAALILGAAMLARVQSSTEILGYPAVAFVFFVAAAVGGVALLVSIVVHDRRTERGGR